MGTLEDLGDFRAARLLEEAKAVADTILPILAHRPEGILAKQLALGLVLGGLILMEEDEARDGLDRQERTRRLLRRIGQTLGVRT